MRTSLIVATLVAAAGLARAQGYATDFDEASDSDWHVTGLWNVDATPSTARGGIYRSGPSSLNYNNRNGNYYTGIANNGSAYSPLINLTHMSSPTLTFWCNYNADTWNSYGLDRRYLYILTPSGGYLTSYTLYGTGASAGIGNCGASGVWHQHSVALNPSHGIVKLRFYFSSPGTINGSYHGWAIDDLAVAPASGGSGTTTQTIYSTGFSGSDWTLAGLWGRDGSPSTMTGGAYRSASVSLNYNDGVDYDTGYANSADARSPLISIPSTGATVTFWCNYKTETSGTAYDRRFVKILKGFDTSLHAQYQLSASTSGAGACAAMGTWHQHSITVPGTLGSMYIIMRFESGDATANAYPGWFLDDLAVTTTVSSTSTSAPAPKTAAYATPFADGSGWSLSGMWGVDGTGVYAPVSGTACLNFNNGADYAGLAYGEARSPLVDTSFLQKPSFTFRCNYQTETTGIDKDKRWVVVQDANGTALASYQLAGVGATAGVGSCAAMGTWHTHRVTLSSSWREVRLVFRFDSVDALSNQYAGWFVDDLFFDLPDLKPVRKDMAQDLRFEVINGRRYIRYTESVANAGFAPMTAIGPVPAFRRFNIKNLSGTTLLSQDVQVGTFASEFLVRKNAPTALPDFGPIGAVQPGYGDRTYVNENSLFTWLDSLSFPDGDYIIEHSWDPLGNVPESDETNNAGTRLVVHFQGNAITVLNNLNP